MDLLLIGVCVVVIVALLLGIKYFSESKKNKAAKARVMQKVHCPLCDSILFKGENLVSKVYRPMNVPEQLMTISGCPHCYPVCENGVKRICPVCHKEVGLNQSLTARLFNRAAGKNHVHILGCPNCRKSNSN